MNIAVFRNLHGVATAATLSVGVLRTTNYLPKGKHCCNGPPAVKDIEAREHIRPKNSPPIRWKFVTNLPVPDLASAIQMLDWYRLR